MFKGNMENGTLVLDSALENSSKHRMRWTPELHSSFEQAVNQLGGPDRATPKGIFKAMSLPGISIAHVKSHLQKYRMINCVLESSDRGKLESRTISDILPNFFAASRSQMKEALQSHLKEQNSSQDQLERCLKIKIELQGRYLENIMEDYRDDNYTNCKSDWPLPTTLSSRTTELSESHSTKCGSDDSEDISQSTHGDAYHKEKLLYGSTKHQISPVMAFSYDESNGFSSLESTPTVSQPSKRPRVGKDVISAFGGSFICEDPYVNKHSCWEQSGIK